MATSSSHNIPVVCDLIIKGGITSGIIYPKLIGKLAENYRLKNIGGTSAGAIAAAGAAAAEFRRQTQKIDAGFEELKKLPDLLSQNVNVAGKPSSKLLSLFQPIPALQFHFKVLLNTSNAKVPILAALETGFQMLRYFPWFCLLGLMIATILLWPAFLGLAGSSQIAVYSALAVLGGWIVDTLAIRYCLGGKIEDNRALRRSVEIWLLIGIFWTSIVAWIPSTITPSILIFSLKVGSLALETLLVGLITIITTLIFFTLSIVCGLTKNGFGFCSGLSPVGSSGSEALTNWLTSYFNELAGLSKTDSPLTFGDLWRGSRDHKIKIPEVKDRVINLEVMTSAVSRKMPYRIPFVRDEEEYYFDLMEWKQLFPKEVIDLLTVQGIDNKVLHPMGSDRFLYRLPMGEKLPIVVAVRMSLSFPILLSAVPLYARDWTLKSVKEAEKNNSPVPTTKVWFSDGGICSNIPLHFFDALLPDHPTFAINLTDKHPDYDTKGGSKSQSPPGFESWRVFLPIKNDQGVQRHWKSLSESGIDNLFSFLWSIIETMQSWRDEIQFPYPGYRDRIVQISQSADEGGLNLNMPQESIKALGNAGENAATQLIGRFTKGDGWDNHRKIRLRNLLAQLSLVLNHIDFSAAAVAGWQVLLNDMENQPPFKLSPNEKRLADKTLLALVNLTKDLDLCKNINSTSLAGNSAPHPFAELRITPRF